MHLQQIPQMQRIIVRIVHTDIKNIRDTAIPLGNLTRYVLHRQDPTNKSVHLQNTEWKIIETRRHRQIQTAVRPWA